MPAAGATGGGRSRRRKWFGLVLAVALTLVGLTSRGLATPEPAPPSGACTFNSATPLFVPMATTFGGVLIDPGCQYVYLTNTSQNRVEVYSLQSQSFEAPIPVGLAPVGLDITSNGSQLYVANSGEHFVSVVDLAQRVETRKIAVPFDAFSNDTPYQIGIGLLGTALIASTSNCSGKCGRVYALTLSDDQVAPRNDYDTFGANTEARTRIAVSADRSTIALAESGTSAGPVHLYSSWSNSFVAKRNLEGDISGVSINSVGSRLMVSRGGYVLNGTLSMTGAIAMTTPFAAGGTAVHSTLPLGFRALTTKVEMYDLSTYLKVGERSLGDSTSNATDFNFVGRMDLSDDSTVLAVVTNNGFAIVRPFPAAPENINLLRNADFAGGLLFEGGLPWQTRVTPDPSSFEGGITGGELQFNRHSPAGPQSESLVFQATGQPLPSGAPLAAQFGLGNSSTVDKTITVVLSDADSSDPHSCTFVVPAASPLKTYRMMAHTTQAWNNASIFFSADTPGSDGGFNRIDNASLIFDSTLTAPDACTPPAPPPPPGNCDISQASPYFVPFATTVSAVLVDDGCRYVFLLNQPQNRVEVFSLQTLSFERPIQVGAQPADLDITTDGNWMFVANRGGNNFSVVDLVQRVEDRKVTLAPEIFVGQQPNQTATSIAIAASGKVLVTTHSWCCTGPNGLQGVDLATGVVTDRKGELQFGFQPTLLRRSRDRSTVALLQSGVSNGPVAIYRAFTDSFTLPMNLNHYAYDVSVSGDGSRAVVTPDGNLLDGTPALVGNLPSSAAIGSAVHPTVALGYRTAGSAVDVFNLNTLAKIGSLPLGDSASSSGAFNGIGRMDISADGKLLAVITNNGFSLVRPFASGPPENFNVVRNGTFAAGTTGWQTYATPDFSYIQSGISNGVFEYNRLTPPQGTSNQAVVFQDTSVPLPAGAPIQAQFDLGNSSSVRKRISVLLLDADFSDLHVCTFWVPPNSALATYRMRSHTTKAWNSAAIYFYAATDGADGGFNRIDNVSLTYDTSLPADRTDCEDPTAPPAPGGIAGPDLIVNGDFSSGSPDPWIVYGTLSSQVSGGTFEFVRPSSAPPAGAVLQLTGQPIAANALLTAAFDLGNSSTSRKRVTVLLHDSDFSDLSACTFWLPAGQPLAQYTMRSFATKAWNNASISVYAATVDTDQWAQLDNVSVRLTPADAIVGTECAEPGAGEATIPGEQSLSQRPAQAAAQAAKPAIAPPVRAPSALERAQVSEWLDLSGAAAARLVLLSGVAPEDGYGEIQISTDGAHWLPVLIVSPTDDWSALELDLGPWLGRPIAIRFVLRNGGEDANGTWLVARLVVDIARRPH